MQGCCCPEGGSPSSSPAPAALLLPEDPPDKGQNICKIRLLHLESSNNYSLFGDEKSLEVVYVFLRGGEEVNYPAYAGGFPAIIPLPFESTGSTALIHRQ